MATKFTVKMSRRTAALYLAKDFGVARANQELRKLVEVTPHFYRLPLAELMFTTGPRSYLRKCDAEHLANRVRLFVAHQQGRLGKPLTGGDVYVIPRARVRRATINRA
jgi:hypothetical protein